MVSWSGRGRVATVWIVLASLLALADLVGNFSPYIYLVVLLMAWPFLLADPSTRQAMYRWESYGYLTAFLALAIAFVFAAGGWEHLDNIFNFLPFVLFIPAIALFEGFARPGNARIVAVMALVGAVFALGTACYDVYVAGLRRAVGFINTTNPFAAVAVMLGFLSLIGFWTARGWVRFLFFVGPIAGVLAATLAGTRSAILLALVLSVVFAIFVGAKLSLKARMIWAGVVILTLAGLVGAVFLLEDSLRAFSAVETLEQFLTEGSAIDRSTAIRIELYKGGIQAFFDAPIFGHGWRHHVQAARPYMEPDISDFVATYSHLHNDFINFAALAGIFGLFAYALYLLIPVVGTFLSTRDSQYFVRLYGATVATFTYAVYGLFGSAFAAELMLCFGPVFAAVLLGFCKDAPGVSWRAERLPPTRCPTAQDDLKQETPMNDLTSNTYAGRTS